MKEYKEGTPQPKEWKPKPAESFLAEFNSGKLADVIAAMRELGFSFRQSKPDTETGASVIFHGERDDGTKVTIQFEKGKNYKSPKEKVDEQGE